MHTLAYRRSWLSGLPLFLITAALLASIALYWLCPSLRLPAHADQVLKPGTVAVVDAKHYDQDWFDAARAGRVDILQALEQAHYPINRQTSAGYTALILAAYDDQPAAVDYLLQHGADACHGDRNGNTALMGALYKGQLAIARRLLQAHCPIDQTNNAGETAMGFAVLFGRLTMLPELNALGANPEHRDARGESLLGIATKQGNRQAIQALRQLGAGG